jgi:hypothetical protein
MKSLLRVIEGHDRSNIGTRLKAQTIATGMGASVKTVERAIKDCVAAGLLAYEPRKDTEVSSRFKIRFDTLAQMIVDNPKTIGLIAPREAPPQTKVRELGYDTCAGEDATLAPAGYDTCDGRIRHMRPPDTTHALVGYDTCDGDEGAQHLIHRARVLKPELNQEEKPSMKPMPPELDTFEFREAWDKWIRHLDEVGKVPSSVAEDEQLAKLAAWGADRASAAIAHSLVNNWKSIHEPVARSEPVATQPGPGQKFDPTAVVGGM